ncbi:MULTISPECIES: hypothetical protein [Pseudomonas]|uniref:hypothetical protein n=1 Tax=Pseudomonas TaxID=286 RepID=UPI0012D39B31|nr:hypothetical protein [Pseudomonas putida]
MGNYKFRNSVSSIAVLFLSGALLSACGGSESEKTKQSHSSPVSQSKASGPSINKAKEDEEFENRNKPLRTEMEAPELADSSNYADILTKLNPIRFYSALRSWEETDEEVASSLKGSILVQHDAPQLFDFENQLNDTSDAFQKREIAQKIAAFVREDSQKVSGSYRVRMTVDAELKPYDFETHKFVSENCLFSEKLAYTADEMRDSNTFAKAQKTRCYVQPSTTNFLVGVVSGSKMDLDIPDEEIAKKIESNRAKLKYEIYGYIRYVERERLGGKPAELRHILIEPQRINLVAAGSGKPIFSRTF